MNVNKIFSDIYKAAHVVPFDNKSKIVIMSDCHRGNASRTDDYIKNEKTCREALGFYYDNGYTYIEIGDGDELWASKKLSSIVAAHLDTYLVLKKFYLKGRMYMLYGNHDMDKRDHHYVSDNYSYYYDTKEKAQLHLFEKIKIHEGIVLKHETTNNEIFLTHGHQVDFINSKIWKFTRFCVRYFWGPLERFGIKDPTNTAKNYKKKDANDRKCIRWVKETDLMLIAGHTHRPMFANASEAKYFNDGSCVYAKCVTAIEIVDGNIFLVRWCTKPDKTGKLSIGRHVLAGPVALSKYWSK